jgi:hypothetical protein
MGYEYQKRMISSLFLARSIPFKKADGLPENLTIDYEKILGWNSNPGANARQESAQPGDSVFLESGDFQICNICLVKNYRFVTPAYLFNCNHYYFSRYSKVIDLIYSARILQKPSKDIILFMELWKKIPSFDKKACFQESVFILATQNKENFSAIGSSSRR